MRGKAPLWGCPLIQAGKRDKQGVLLVRAAAARRFTLFPRRGNRAAERCAPRRIVRMRCNAVARLSESLAMMTRLFMQTLPTALRKRGQKCLFLTPAPSFAFQEVPQSPVFGPCSQHQCDRKSSAFARFCSITSASGSVALLCSAMDEEKE